VTATATPLPSALAPAAPLLAALCDLKRIHVADASGSVAERLFLRAWAAVAAGAPAGAVAREVTGDAVAAVVLSGVEDRHLEMLAPARRDALRAAAITEALGPELGDVARALAGRESGDGPARRAFDGVRAPDFAHALCAQPRAGATAPGRRRVVLHPAESHGDHCLAVAAGAAVLALADGLDPGRPFLAGLAHHLHNAAFPDAGFAGEVLLGEDLETVFAAHRDAALGQLDPDVARAAADAAGLALRVDLPEARAVVAADTLDRVLELDWHARSAAFTLDVALDDLELVHEGPLQAFGEAALRGAGLR
jgi:hypothetical protein